MMSTRSLGRVEVWSGLGTLEGVIPSAELRTRSAAVGDLVGMVGIDRSLGGRSHSLRSASAGSWDGVVSQGVQLGKDRGVYAACRILTLLKLVLADGEDPQIDQGGRGPVDI